MFLPSFFSRLPLRELLCDKASPRRGRGLLPVLACRRLRAHDAGATGAGVGWRGPGAGHGVHVVVLAAHRLSRPLRGGGHDSAAARGAGIEAADLRGHRVRPLRLPRLPGGRRGEVRAELALLDGWGRITNKYVILKSRSDEY